MIKQGEIYLADLSDGCGSEQGGTRPVVIVQNDVGNRYSPTTIVCPITSKKKKTIPTHVFVAPGEGVEKDSTVLCEQIRAVDQQRLIKKLGAIRAQKMGEIKEKCNVCFG